MSMEHGASKSETLCKDYIQQQYFGVHIYERETPMALMRLSLMRRSFICLVRDASTIMMKFSCDETITERRLHGKK